MRRLGPTTPILGVCLGHQCIGAAYGGEIVRGRRPMHGKTSRIVHDGTSVFAGLPSPLRVARYHSLVIAPESLPASLRVTARAEDDGAIMAVEHREHPVVGVQFHPESAATHHGYAMVDRFLKGAVRRGLGAAAARRRRPGRRWARRPGARPKTSARRSCRRRWTRSGSMILETDRDHRRRRRRGEHRADGRRMGRRA